MNKPTPNHITNKFLKNSDKDNILNHQGKLALLISGVGATGWPFGDG